MDQIFFRDQLADAIKQYLQLQMPGARMIKYYSLPDAIVELSQALTLKRYCLSSNFNNSVTVTNKTLSTWILQYQEHLLS